MPDDLRLAPGEALRLAQRLINEGRPFHAHEALEAAWKTGPVGERELWQGLAQLAVGLTHARRGNERGAITLLRRGAAAVASYAGELPGGLAASAAVTAARDLADRIEHHGLATLSDTDLQLNLQEDPPEPSTN